MILVRWLARTWSALSAPPPGPLPGPRALPSYARMGRYIAGGAALDPRIDLLVRQLAALAFTEAVSRYTDRAGGFPDAVLGALRSHFSEQEVAALTLAVADEHFFNPATGALGADARLATPGDLGVRRAAGSAMRNLW